MLNWRIKMSDETWRLERRVAELEAKLKEVGEKVEKLKVTDEKMDVLEGLSPLRDDSFARYNYSCSLPPGQYQVTWDSSPIDTGISSIGNTLSNILGGSSK
jgi:hypothetical protein